MNTQDMALLLHALSAPGVSFILGAGASAPNLPTFAQLPSAISANVDRLRRFPASPIQQSGLRALVQPIIQQAQRTSELAEWKAGAMTTATIAAILHRQLSRAHARPLPQYRVFALFPVTASVVSFNWDGLAIAQCPQYTVLHPHGIVHPVQLGDAQFTNLLWQTQSTDEPLARHWYLPGLVLPGEEQCQALRDIREEVLKLWMTANSLVVVGYSFGISSRGSYDSVWLDTFSEACIQNPATAVHIISPDAEELRQAICDRIGRTVNVFAWSSRWDVLSRVLLRAANCISKPLSSLRCNRAEMELMVRSIAELSER